MKPKKTKRRFTELTCDDCRFKLVAGGEYCLINPQIWGKKLGLDWENNLCIGCIEARLGRNLKRLDFLSLPQNPGGFANSDRYARRVLGERGFAISKLKHGDKLPKGWRWRKDRGRWYATNRHVMIEAPRASKAKTLVPTFGRTIKAI